MPAGSRSFIAPPLTHMNILVYNLSANIMEDDLKRLFSVYGTVGFVVIVRDKVSGRSKGNAFVEMPIQGQGEQAIKALHHMEVDGLHISVQEIGYIPGEFNN
jgi:RNA recognition motif-containing protein